LWSHSVNIKELPTPEILDYEDLRKSEWSPKFEELMRERLILGAYRYGRIFAKDKPKYDRIASIIKRLRKFEVDGNKEHLVDAANLCLLEFVECNHPNAHFTSIDDGEHTKIINEFNL